MADSEKPIIVRKRVIKGGGAAHSSAWKIAFADFAVAMMAFFMVMWLMNVTSPEEKEAIAGYFANPAGYKDGGFDSIINLGGDGDKVLEAATKTNGIPEKDPSVSSVPSPSPSPSPASGSGLSDTESFQFKQLAYELKKKIAENPALQPYQDQVLMSLSDTGLEIQIMDKSFRPMFDSGSDVIKPHMQTLLQELGKAIGALPNQVIIAGHTDASVYTGRQNYSNWELSADRANTARRILQSYGAKEAQIKQVIGHGSADLYDKQHPESPVNRRLSILILNQPLHTQTPQPSNKSRPAQSPANSPSAVTNNQLEEIDDEEIEPLPDPDT